MKLTVLVLSTCFSMAFTTAALAQNDVQLYEFEKTIYSQYGNTTVMALCLV